MQAKPPHFRLFQGGIGVLGDPHRQLYSFGEAEGRPRPAVFGV